jgi:hypothetical protein
MKGKFVLLCTPHFDGTDTTESTATSFIVNKQVTRFESGNYTIKFAY